MIDLGDEIETRSREYMADLDAIRCLVEAREYDNFLILIADEFEPTRRPASAPEAPSES